MNGNKIFVDTNILIYFLKGDHEVVEMISDKDLVISFISELELLSFPDISIESQNSIKGLLMNCIIVDINNTIKESAINIRKKSKLKLPDSIIAASAHSLQLPLLTADRQFKSVNEIDVILYEV